MSGKIKSEKNFIHQFGVEICKFSLQMKLQSIVFSEICFINIDFFLDLFLIFLYFIFRRLRGWWWCEVHLLVCVHNYNWLSKFSKFQDWFEQGERSLDSMTAIKRNQDDGDDSLDLDRLRNICVWKNWISHLNGTIYICIHWIFNQNQ